MMASGDRLGPGTGAAAVGGDRRCDRFWSSCSLWTGVASAASASVVYRGSTERKQIALTFDDNTKVDRALATLRALQKHGVPATLFLIGSSVNAYPAINSEIVKGMKRAACSRWATTRGRTLCCPGSPRIGHGRPDRRRHRRLPQGHRSPDGAALPPALRLDRLAGGGGRRQ